VTALQRAQSSFVFVGVPVRFALWLPWTGCWTSDLPTSLRVDACRLVDGRALTTTRGKNPRNRLWFRWCHLGIV